MSKKSKKNRRTNQQASAKRHLDAISETFNHVCCLLRNMSERLKTGQLPEDVCEILEKFESCDEDQRTAAQDIISYIEHVRDSGFDTDPLRRKIVHGDVETFASIITPLCLYDESIAPLLALFLATPYQRFKVMNPDKFMVPVAGHVHGFPEMAAAAMKDWRNDDVVAVQKFWANEIASEADLNEVAIMSSALGLVNDEVFRRWGHGLVEQSDSAARAARRL